MLSCPQQSQLLHVAFLFPSLLSLISSPTTFPSFSPYNLSLHSLSTISPFIYFLQSPPLFLPKISTFNFSPTISPFILSLKSDISPYNLPFIHSLQSPLHSLPKIFPFILPLKSLPTIFPHPSL